MRAPRLAAAALVTLTCAVWFVLGGGPAPTGGVGPTEGVGGEGGDRSRAAATYEPGARELVAETGPDANSAAGAASSAPSGPNGRVESGEGEGIPAVDVELFVAGERIARATTGRDGLFELPRPDGADAASAVVALRPDPRWTFERDRVSLTRAQTDGSEPLVFRGWRSNAGIFRGMLVDARTREPVPHFKFICWDSTGADNHVTSDAEGRFATHQDYGPGRLRLALGDFAGSFSRYGSVDVVRDDPTSESVVPVPIGPTYRLNFTPPPGYPLSEFFAEVRGHRRAARHYPQFFMRSRLRSGASPWVRLHPDELTEGPGPPWNLTVISDDGLWSGSVEVDSLVGIYPEVLALRVSAAGALRGRVQDQDGNPQSVNLHLSSLVDEWEDWFWTSREGSLRYRGLPPGEYELALEHPDFEPFERTLRVESAREVVLDLVLHKEPAVGAIRGTVVSDSNRASALVMRATDERGGWRDAHVMWTAADEGGRGERVVGSFAFSGLADGTWIVRPMAETLGFESTPASLVLDVPADGARFQLHDEVARVDYWLEVIDLATGEALPDAELTVELGSGTTAVYRVPDGRPVFEQHAMTLEFDWIAWSPGHGAVGGDETAFEDRGDRRVAVARLKPGWGGVLELFEYGSDARVAGVSLSVDGEPCGPSDARGRILLSRADPPERVSVMGADWRLGPRNWVVDPATGRFRSDGGRSGIYLVRAE